MGLFSNNKKLCPICGSPTPRLLATKIEGQPICKECDSQIDLPDGAVNRMSLSDFRQYLAAFAENKCLQSEFQSSYQFHIGFWSGTLYVDEAHGLLRAKESSGWVFEGRNLKSFRISEDGETLFESGDGVLSCHASSVPDRVNDMAQIIAQFHMHKQEYERREAMEDLRNCMDESSEERRERQRTSDLYRPRFEAPAPVQKFRIEIILDHPYWQKIEDEFSGPEFDRDYPRAEDYLKSYREQTEELHLLASRLMHMMDPNAGEVHLNSSAVAQAAQSGPAAPADAVNEIQRYKALLDAGVLTEEEFAAKKRQLLGI